MSFNYATRKLFFSLTKEFTWFISNVLHTVCFLFKNEFILKINLQAFNVISIVLYHGGPTFGKVLYSCLDAFVVDVSDYSGHLLRHLLNASEAFPTEWFLQFWEQVKVWWAEATRLSSAHQTFTCSEETTPWETLQKH
jgi:hypothetical protein